MTSNLLDAFMRAVPCVITTFFVMVFGIGLLGICGWLHQGVLNALHSWQGSYAQFWCQQKRGFIVLSGAILGGSLFAAFILYATFGTTFGIFTR